MSQIAEEIIEHTGDFKFIMWHYCRLRRDGYKMKYVSQKRDWPKFWRIIYTVKFIREVYVDLKILCDTSGFDKAMEDLKLN